MQHYFYLQVLIPEQQVFRIYLQTLSGHTGGINCMDILDNQLLTGSDDRTARLWDLTTQECKVGWVYC